MRCINIYIVEDALDIFLINSQNLANGKIEKSIVL